MALPRSGKGKRTSQQAVLAEERVSGCLGRQVSSLFLEGHKHRLVSVVNGGGGVPELEFIAFAYWYFPPCFSSHSGPGTRGTSPHGVYNRAILNSGVLGSPLGV